MQQNRRDGENAFEVPQGGFNFDNCLRNQFLMQNGYNPPKYHKTGTTIAGMIFADGVILGADTRATEGTIVCDKNCEKIHFIAPNIYCCGAGTSADTEASTGLISSQLKLHRFSTRKESRVVTAMTMLKQYLFRYQGNISAALVLGGVDVTGPHIYSVWPHGSTDKLPFVTMGSGSLAAMAVFEDGWKEGMSLQDGMDLTKRAIRAGIFNDLGSGSNVDLVVITKGKVDIHRNIDVANPRLFRREYHIKLGSTEVLKERVKDVPRELVETEQEEDQTGEPMAMKTG